MSRLVEAKPSRAARSGPRVDPRNATLPADRFLWAVLDAPGRPGRSVRSGAAPLAPGLWPQLAEQVHVDADSLVAVATPIDDGRLLVCAIEREALAGAPAAALRLSPETIPPGVVGGPGNPATSIDPARLDLLVGEFLPAPARRRHRLRHVLAAGCVSLCAVLASVGLSRRSAVWDSAAREANARVALVATTIDPRATIADLPFLADEARSEARAVADLGTPTPIAPVLADLLAHWPGQSPPSTLNVEPGTILATVLVERDPAEFLAALRPPTGWRMQEPRLSAVPDGTQVTIVMQPVSGAREGAR